MKIHRRSGLVSSALLLALSCGATSCDRRPPDAAGAGQVARTVAPSVQARIVKEISEILGKDPSELTQEKRIMADLGADSLDLVEIVMALEEEFNISIDDESAGRISTIGDVIRYVGPLVKP